MSLGHKSYSPYGNGKGLFFDCPLEKLYLGRNLSYTAHGDYGYSPFCNVNTLKDITIGNYVKSTGVYMFRGCTGLTNFTIPDNVITIGYGTFEECSNLVCVDIPNSVTTIGEYSFCNCSSLTNTTIPNSVTTIGYAAFWCCTSLTNIDIPNSVTAIGSYAFWLCEQLINVTISNRVTSIDYGTFGGCSNLTSVTIPSSVASIGEGAFRGSPNIREIYSFSKTPAKINYDSFDNYSSILYVPKGTKSVYQTADYWKNFKYIVETDFTGITEISPDDIEGFDDGAIYDLYGRPVNEPAKGGVYIIDGKKVVL